MSLLTFFVGRHGGDSKSYDEDDHSGRWLTGAVVDELSEQGRIYFGESFNLASSITSRTPTLNALIPGTTPLPELM